MRREPGQEGARNGYKPRALRCAEGRLEIDVPQVRGLEGRCQPTLWRALKRRTDVLERLVVEMYARGLSTRDIEDALAELAGEDAPLLSRSTVSRITDALHEEFEAFARRDLSGLDVVYLFADAVYESLRRQAGCREGILVTWAVLGDGSKVLKCVTGGRNGTPDAGGRIFGGSSMEAGAGFTEIDITPPAGVALVGYHRASPATGVLDPLAATALVLEAGGTRLVVVSVDHIGMTVSHATRVRERIARALRLETSQVMLLFTHTHSGPETEDEVPLHREYREFLTARLERVAAEAAGRLRPCRVAWGVTSGRIGVNRRMRGPDGRARYGVNEDGPVDDRVGVLRVDDTETARLLGLLVIVTAHGTVLRGDNTLISADFPGWARRRLAGAAGCPVMVANGAAGNVNPRWRGSVADLERMAAAVADPVLALLPELRTAPMARLWVGTSTVQARLVPLPPPEEAAALAALVAREWGCPAGEWLELVTRLYGQGRRHLSLPVEVHLARIHDGFIAGIPAEPFAELALELRRRCRHDAAFLLGYANGLYGYLPTAEEFHRGGYEVEWMPVCYGTHTGLLMPFEPGTAGRILEEIVQLWRASGAGGTSP